MKISVIEIKEISVIADYFIIANGANSLQVDALVDSVRTNWEETAMSLYGWKE